MPKIYGIKKECGFNCLIVECKKKDDISYCALIVPIGYKYNMGSVVRKYTNSRVVSVAPLDFVLEKTNMEVLRLLDHLVIGKFLLIL